MSLNIWMTDRESVIVENELCAKCLMMESVIQGLCCCHR